MATRKWARISIENLEWKIAFEEHQRRYEAAETLRNLFDFIELDEENIAELKKSFARWDASK